MKITIPDIIRTDKRYFVMRLKNNEEHSLALHLQLYEEGQTEPVFFVRFGILPYVVTTVCIDRSWVNANDLYPGSLAGELKVVCHGRRTNWNDIERAELSILPCFHDADVILESAELTDDFPTEPELSDGIFVDLFGQNKKKEWTGKIKDERELTERLLSQLEISDSFPEYMSRHGGFKAKKLSDGTGYFDKIKKDGRWHITDPEGYEFFSMGADCVNLHPDCRINGIEKWLEYLPDRNDEKYRDMFIERNDVSLFSYMMLNYYRAYGSDYKEKWQRVITSMLKSFGMNTLGNWSDRKLMDSGLMPYVDMLPEFPTTKVNIFRDFPDVFSKEYAESARECAKELAKRKDDPWMIGYFLRNEPSWAFVDNLIIADEVLLNPADTACRRRLKEFLTDRYGGSIESLNGAWKSDFASFDAFDGVIEKASSISDSAKADLKEFSVKMIKAYVEIPAGECRKADQNHMILGMRWAWISDPDLAAGWESFDVFSINCYAVDPTEAIEHVAELGVDLPVMIGEFHFGALDRGPTATGLEGTATQEDRAKAYSYYLERVAASSCGVGAHYFQCYDQFVLGRFDGENYNIGLFDVCGQPYPEMAEASRRTSERIQDILSGKEAPTEDEPKTIPMIAY